MNAYISTSDKICGTKESLFKILEEIGQEHMANEIARCLGEKVENYKSQRAQLGYMTKFQNMLKERITMLKEQNNKPYFESAQFKQDLAEELNSNKLPYSIDTPQKKISLDSLYEKEAINNQRSVFTANKEEFRELLALPAI